ncbi:MAG: zinc ribbon domain-containing protein, partial [Anaerolineaceae bacterium]
MTQDRTVSKPLPEADDSSRPFFEGAMHSRLMLMKCSTCGAVRLPSRHHCDDCLSPDFAWVTASGRGTVRTFGVMHQKYHPGFEVPYNVTV